MEADCLPLTIMYPPYLYAYTTVYSSNHLLFQAMRVYICVVYIYVFV